MTTQTKNKIIYSIVILVAVLAGIIVFVVVNPTNNPKITETKEKFIPFGNTPSVENTQFMSTTTPSRNSTIPPDNQLFSTQKMRHLVDVPVAGATFFTNDSEQTAIRYVKQKTGDIYDYSLDTGISKLVLQQNLPGVHNVLWNNNGKNAVFRFLKTVGNQETIKTYLLSFEETTMEDSAIFEGRFLPDELPEVIVSPDSEKIMYIQKNKKGDSFVMSEEIRGNRDREQLFASPFSEWLLEQPKEGLLTLTTKPSYNVDGYLYFTDITSGVTTKMLGDKKGLMALTSPDATKILYATSEKDSYKLILYDAETKKETVLDIKAFPEKCVWGTRDSNLIYCAVSNLTNNKNMPDSWYQGETSFSDDIWLLNTETGKTGLFSKTKDFTEWGIDVIKPLLSPEDSHLLFTNKLDGTLWLLELENIETQDYE